MIKKLQRRFIMITMVSLVLVMLLLVGAINGLTLYQMEEEVDGTIQFLSANQGEFPKSDKKEEHLNDPKWGFELTKESPFETRFFIVEVDMLGNINTIDTSHIAAVTSSEAETYANNIMVKGEKSGYQGIYKYAVVEQDGGSMIILLDCSKKITTAKVFLCNSGLVALITLLLMFILISFLSKRAIKPFIETTEKQKQFITDAGHEIKTPLAIISANADVLELTGGKSEWISSIRNQITRLDKLVKNLLTLSRMEEGNIKTVFTEIDLSKVVLETAGPFEPMAQMQNKKFEMNIQPGLKLHGDESSIQQLISTLADNAIKYSDTEGLIRITLSCGKKGSKLEVYNTTEGIGTENLDRLFDRFYRADSSRARETGGNGIGLSIAKSIVLAHQGKISVKSEDGNSICFKVLF